MWLSLFTALAKIVAFYNDAFESLRSNGKVVSRCLCRSKQVPIELSFS